MKIKYLPYYFVLLTLVTFCQGLQSQDLFINAAGERIQVCTDRTMYVAGEKVYFSAVVYNVMDTSAAQFSRTFYCELITPHGTRIAGRKYMLQNSSGQGCITIPEETISGIYFLKFYTRFMRNLNTDKYKYIMLKIINPLKTEVLSENNSVDTSNLAGNRVDMPSENMSLSIIPGKVIYSPREEIRLNIGGNTSKGVSSRFCLSVIPELTNTDSYNSPENKQSVTNNVLYYPETRGVSLMGQLIEKESRKPVPHAKVNLSVIGDKDILVVRTDSSGRYFFALPDYDGKKDIFLCSDDLPDVKTELLIDNDFCSKPVVLSAPLFKLNEEEMKVAYNLAVNIRVATMFRDDSTTVVPPPGEENNISFYGEPTDILVMAKYIDLPTLGEYFTELPGIVKLRKVHGKRQFTFFDIQSENAVYEPLILVDWVAVNNIEKVLAMSPLEIDRIELVNSLYVKGNITYGGIISFVSRKNDFAGIDLPTSGTFVNYRFLEKCTDNFPSTPLAGSIPDSRNTVYWNPAVPINDGTFSISCLAPDTPGKYDILLREINKTGEVSLTKARIVVKGN